MAEPDVLPDGEVERALVVMAHPDDIDFGCAGTIATWTDAGIEVTYLLVTSGDAGGFDEDVPRDQVPLIREREQTAAAAEVGVNDVRFLRYPDGGVEVTVELRRDVSRVIRQVRPRRVLTMSPEWNLDRMPVSHPDHMHTGEATIRAVYPDARNPFAHTALLRDEGLRPWSVEELWIGANKEPNHSVDVTAVVDRKFKALAAHISQFPKGFDTVEPMVREWMAGSAAAAGLPDGSLAEVFSVHRIPA